MKWFAGVAILFLIALIAFAVLRRRAGNRTLAPLTPAQTQLVPQLRRDVEALCALGPRNLYSDTLPAAADFIERSFAPHAVERHGYDVEELRAENLVVELRGSSRPKEIVVIGAHYDSVDVTPGADDNASGVAGLLALARRFANAKPERTLRFVAFVNEEPPFFQTASMGSYQYAKRCHDRGETVVAMLSLEMLGYYDPRRGAQQYPPALSAFFPDTGDFLAFTGNLGSRALMKQCVRAFRRHRGGLPVESATLPQTIPQVGWSDQWSFWQFGWPGVMVTDTALFRNPHYHMPSDLPPTLDYARMARAVDALATVVADLSSETTVTSSSM